MKFKVIVGVEMEVEAKDYDTAEKEIKYNKLFLDVAGCHVDYGGYSLKTIGKQSIQLIEKK